MTEREKDAAAVRLGRKGGKVKSEAKTAAARENGRKGAAARWKGHKPKGKR